MLPNNTTHLKGFALLEILLALGLASAVLGVTLPAFAMTVARLQDFYTTSAALALAKAKLTEFKHETIMERSAVQGKEGPFFWQLSITNLSPLPSSSEFRGIFLLQELTIRVALQQAQDQPLAELKTRRIETLR